MKTVISPHNGDGVVCHVQTEAKEISDDLNTSRSTRHVKEIRHVALLDMRTKNTFTSPLRQITRNTVSRRLKTFADETVFSSSPVRTRAYSHIPS